MGNVLFFLPVFAFLAYIAIIYTSKAMLMLVFASVVLYGCFFLYLVIARMLLEGKVVIPIAVTDVEQPVTVQFQIRNRGMLPVFQARIFMEVYNSYEDRKTVHSEKISHIYPGDNMTEFHLILDQPGNYEVSLRKIQIFDPAGICYMTKRFSSKKEVQVMPKFFSMYIVLTKQVQHFLGDSDIYDEEKPGYDNSEVFQIRPYLPGDRLQRIHWKLSMKTDEWMVKESSLPKACPVVLLFDYDRDRRGKKAGSFGAFLEIGASLSFSLMDQRCAHYVAWFEEHSQDMTRIRIEDEESFYLFLSCYLHEKRKTSPDGLKMIYDEKYRLERYLHLIRLTEELVIYKDEEEICRLGKDRYLQQLGGVEIVL